MKLTNKINNISEKKFTHFTLSVFKEFDTVNHYIL